MKYLIYFLILISATSIDIKGQMINVNIQFVDKGSNKIVYAELVIDSVIYTSFIFNNKIELYKGFHRFIGRYDKQNLIDTMIYVSDSTSIILPIDLINDGLLWDFKTDFDKIYYDYNNSIVIGLRKDNTFLRKSYFHMSIVGCDQYESGSYQLLNDTLLLLNVDYIDNTCAKTGIGNISHQYRHIIKNDSITDIDKYVGFIEKKYFEN